MSIIETSMPTQVLQLRCKDCDGLFDDNAPIRVEIRVWTAHVMAIRCPHCGSNKILMGQGRSWAEDRDLMKASRLADEEVRAADWLVTGERGASAMSIHSFMTKGQTRDASHPRDVGDLRRCMLLLRRMPEWAPRMEEMAKLSEEWKRIAPRWGEMTRTFTRETGPDYRNVPARATAAILSEALGDLA